MNAEAGLKEWVIKASQKNTSTFNFEKTGQSTPPKSIDWVMNENRHSIPSLDNRIDVVFQIRDMSGQNKGNFHIHTNQLYFNYQKKTRADADKEISRYNLILFEFSKISETVGREEKIIDIIKKNLNLLRIFQLPDIRIEQGMPSVTLN